LGGLGVWKSRNGSTSRESILRHLKVSYGIDSIQFYDNNFFLREDHAQELCERLKPLKLKWWCEARIDILLRYSDLTLRSIREAGCEMIFFGAESGSDWVLKEMKKQLTTNQTIELARRIRHQIIPEFSGWKLRIRPGYAGMPSVYSKDQEDQSGFRNHIATLHSCSSTRNDVWEYSRSDPISGHH
jgi:hypothetical protein